MIPDDPRALGLPHDTWREHQRETAQWCEDLSGVAIIEMPVGSGKTALAAACAWDHTTTAICRTKNLQAENYGDLYGFDVLFGKGNYTCIHPDAPYGTTCADCLHVERGEGGKGMHDCEYSEGCEYLCQKAKVLGSRRASLNYSYWLSSPGVRGRGTRALFLDECHQLSDLVLDWSGCTITNAERIKWGLPLFPLASSRAISSSRSLVQVEEVDTDRVMGWLAESMEVLERTLKELEPRDEWDNLLPMPKEQRKVAQECEHLLRKLRGVLEGLETVEEDWYVQSGPLALVWGEERRPGLLIRPLTARYHYPRFFPAGNGAEMDVLHPRCVLMSATVGNFDAFAQELGIGQFSARRVPSQWRSEQRPVYVLDVPRLGYKSGRGDYDKQADAIAQAILTVPRDWSGIIHVTRKREAPLLANRLGRRGLQDRVWVPPEGSTNWAARQWESRKRKVPGSLMVSWQFHEGFDGLDERICICAKVPFPSLGDPYEQARQRRSGRFYLQRTAWGLMQQLGRTRRGRECDYDSVGERRGLVLIADLNWTRVRRYLSTDFLESVGEWQ